MSDVIISWVDIVFLVLLAASVLLGLWRGLVFEVLAIAGWVVAYFACPYIAPFIEPWLPEHRMSPELVHLAGLVLGFMLVIVVWSLAAKLLRALIHASPLSALDRLGGAGFGLVRGLLVCLLLTVVVSLTPARASPTWQASAAVPWLHGALHAMRPMLPEALNKLIPEVDAPEHPSEPTV